MCAGTGGDGVARRALGSLPSNHGGRPAVASAAAPVDEEALIPAIEHIASAPSCDETVTARDPDAGPLLAADALGRLCSDLITCSSLVADPVAASQRLRSSTRVRRVRSERRAFAATGVLVPAMHNPRASAAVWARLASRSADAVVAPASSSSSELINDAWPLADASIAPAEPSNISSHGEDHDHGFQ